MRTLCIIAAVVGALVAIADAWFRMENGYRVGFEQALELFMVAIVAALAQLWPPAPRDRDEPIGTRGP